MIALFYETELLMYIVVPAFMLCEENWIEARNRSLEMVRHNH